MKIFGVKWYWWLVGLAVPGGLFVLAMAKANGNQAKDLGGTNAAATADARAAGIADNARSLIDNAKAAAAQLLAGLQDNPLAATLLGISPSLLQSASPQGQADAAAAKAAADAAAAKNADIRSHIAALENQLAQYQAGYARDHNGGQSPGQESAIENSIVSQIQALQAQLTA